MEKEMRREGMEKGSLTSLSIHDPKVMSKRHDETKTKRMPLNSSNRNEWE